SLAPTRMTPLVGSDLPLSSPSTNSAGGFFPPSYHVILNFGAIGAAPAGRSGWRSKAVSMTDHLGGLSAVPPADSADTDRGAGRPRAKKTTSVQWQAMSPKAPVPKSQNPRHLNGA